MSKTETVLKNVAQQDHPVADKLQNTLHDSVDALADKVGSAEEVIRETAQSSSATLAKKQIEIESKWNNSVVKKYATENPIATAGLAFSAGMLISALLKRK
tara:strand:+ start:719 stop:1021 length:303 start_codon:yes stop_codon:yes gene_type:complete